MSSQSDARWICRSSSLARIPWPCCIWMTAPSFKIPYALCTNYLLSWSLPPQTSFPGMQTIRTGYMLSSTSLQLQSQSQPLIKVGSLWNNLYSNTFCFTLHIYKFTADSRWRVYLDNHGSAAEVGSRNHRHYSSHGNISCRDPMGIPHQCLRAHGYISSLMVCGKHKGGMLGQ